MSQAFHDLEQLARRYCRIIEGVDQAGDGWLREVFRLLPRIHAAITELLEEDARQGDHAEANLEVRFELFSKLHQLLGERDPYWMEYDLGSEECRSGSLADDLTDIYCELKQGLKLLEEQQAEPERILDRWRRGYMVHWGRHLVDAERHLYDLSTRGAL